jgi:type IV pilus assembly protein PilN
MIRINLLREKSELTSATVMELGGYLGCLLLGVVTCIGYHEGAVGEVERAREESEHLHGRLKKLEQLTKDVGELEGRRAQLKERLQAIAYLKAFQHGPVQILDAINTAIPAQAWLTSITEKGGLLEVRGIALDNQTVAQFFENLSKQGAYLGEVELVESVELQMCIKDHNTEKLTAGEFAGTFDGIGMLIGSGGVLQHLNSYHAVRALNQETLQARMKELARDLVKLKQFTLAVQLLDPVTKKPRAGSNPESLLKGAPRGRTAGEGGRS